MKSIRILITALFLFVIAVSSVSAASGKVFKFDKGLDEAGYTYSAYNSNFKINKGILEITVEKTDVAGGIPIFFLPDNLKLDINKNKYVIVKLRNESTVSSSKIYWTTTDDKTYDESKALAIEIGTKMSDFQEIVFDLSDQKAWKGTLKGLRLDSLASDSNPKGAKVFIESIEIASTPESSSTPAASSGEDTGSTPAASNSVDTNSNTETGDAGATTASNPKTGDNGTGMYFLIVMIAAAALFLLRKKKSFNN
ncbi:hypothetical protein Back11_62860 [Paenibacillus baekrokdamisoli]|uniref:Uncharacterized protein n=1 Tax=Paenibacillus baekrokdamisoli TaxID=1712516 RepID=A0A3G9JGB7_9BACL|nr:LPXTG cell wall anchor domain-containing protein [Paenibacillus baekrokdamisoli]MBB3069485.1 LPXTG-motif cell wall-anchored protein [Paenibacillus baekrokdamisoli]BBH24941.1 hypothetical protein Back11_62860 [Paenibacillus baekrokdamisoli]